MSSLLIPTIPNSPLNSKEDLHTFGRLRLRHNKSLHFVENAEFDVNLITYDDNYQNSQAYSQHFFEHMKSVLELLKTHVPKNSSVVEVGCGKGDFIEMMQADGYFKAAGYDAAYEGDNPNIHKRYLAVHDKIKTDMIVLRHVLEHVPQPHKFLSILKNIFGTSKIYIEVPNYDWIIENEAFFDITYEHVNYFSQKSLQLLFSNNELAQGLCFGNQYQYIIADLESLSTTFEEYYNNEIWEDISFEKTFPNLLKKISELDLLLSKGGNAYLWGAATKGCMFLVHCANHNKIVDKIKFAIDANPNKWGKFLPCSLIPIMNKECFFQQATLNDLLIISNSIYLIEISKEIAGSDLKDIKIVCL